MTSPRPSSSPTAPPPRARRGALPVVLLLVGVIVVSVAVVLGGLTVASGVVAWPRAGGAHAVTVGGEAVVSGGAAATGEDAATGEAGGVLPEGAGVDDDLPGVTGLDPALRDALRGAADAAAADGVVVVVNSGWRSAALQQQMLDDAVARYGSREEASRWVATPATSAHVHGDAVDVGPFDATYWLSQEGAAWGLCQIYGNESWHFELRPEAVTEGCPAMFDDPTHDPRMQP